MEYVNKLPQAKHTIGTKEIIKGIKAGNIKKVIIAENCPDNLIESIKASGTIDIMIFHGDQKELATALGKPFCVASVGFEA
ncbi:MAG: ribosomal L7Ae/L30e/S12e/Gadd45 family protein [Candidatus Aenigmatarchaeota archaeon]